MARQPLGLSLRGCLVNPSIAPVTFVYSSCVTWKKAVWIALETWLLHAPSATQLTPELQTVPLNDLLLLPKSEK